MKSTETPWTHTGVTEKDQVIEFSPSGSVFKHSIMVPAGTKCRKLEGGSEPWVIDDLSFMPDKKSIAYGDADIYGIPVPEELVVNIEPVAQYSPRA
ncbi:hypothetical protein [Devosia sp.]|uniref:hypothetical protein n=1 Tax=Devosia sp. TaxID=1871048 RepID=UPI0027331813|nr:hypothetical protein [Devosia sp.]MDP2782260.1 hypothetical protein [Devosia sp.]